MSFIENYEFAGVPFCIGHVDFYEANKPYKITFKDKD
jgi:hypothetical protein